MKIAIPVKPLSVNQVWQGRRFKTPAYKAFEEEVLYFLRGKKFKKTKGPLEVYYVFSLKNHKRTDYDNLIKPLQDILVKAGLIADDRLIYRAVVEKRGALRDSIEVQIKPYV